MDSLSAMLWIGTGATLMMDLWMLIRKYWLGSPLPDYGLVGRWLGQMADGRFWHPNIRQAEPVRREVWLGWGFHYGAGLLLAWGLMAVAGPGWLQQPDLAIALLWGLVTLALPLLVMQPATGAGWAAAKTPNPTAARLQSLVTHLVFGFGLWLSAELYRKVSL